MHARFEAHRQSRRLAECNSAIQQIANLRYCVRNFSAPAWFNLRNLVVRVALVPRGVDDSIH